MSIPLPIFVAIPLVTAFLLPIFGKKLKALATLLANLAAVSLLVLAVASIGRSAVYEVGKWSIPIGINLVLDGLSSLLLLVISVVSAAGCLCAVQDVGVEGRSFPGDLAVRDRTAAAAGAAGPTDGGGRASHSTFPLSILAGGCSPRRLAALARPRAIRG